MLKLLTTTAAATLFMAGAVAAQELDYDTDMDQQVSMEEFGEANAFEDQWAEWTGDDSQLSEEEWESAEIETDASFSDWDEDGDGLLSEDEFEGGVFTSYDEDESGFWDEDEQGVFEDDGWF